MIEPDNDLSFPDPGEKTLDPEDWTEFERLAHQALDDALTYLRTARQRAVWSRMPEEIRRELSEPVPIEPQNLDAVYRDFQRQVLPYVTGNTHPRFFGWVHGTGQAGGVVAEMLAAAANANCGGRDHSGIQVERCVLEWWRQLLGFPEGSSGLLVSGTSMATLVALTVARNESLGPEARRQGLYACRANLVGYASAQAHECVGKAFELLGLGSDNLRRVAVDERLRIRPEAVRRAIAEDRRMGHRPFCVVGTAGTVNTGAVDDLGSLSEICREEGLWFHVDGAFGALCVLHDELKKRVRGIEAADSVGFDFHKWLHVPYDAGCVLIRHGKAHQLAFSGRPHYLQSAQRGLAGGGSWPCEYGPELSRSFRALKVWFAMKEHGVRKFGELIWQNCLQAQYLASLIQARPELELLAQPELNIVCFRYRAEGLWDQELDTFNRELVADLQECGLAAPSTTSLSSKLAIRAALTNHRTRREDLQLLVDSVVELGDRRRAEMREHPSNA